jgi:hypothetical protein
VRGALAWLVALIASCAPDYAHTAFRCTGDGGCPAGQTCLDGRCRRGAPIGDGVACGSDACDAHHQCCLDLFNPPRCIAAGDVCPGTAALCDGIEDCQAGDRCCADGDTVFCDAACDRYACRDAADCPSTAPSCCPDDATPWGQCSRLGC